MTGIVGIFELDGRPASTGKLSLMLAAPAGRGSGNNNLWHSNQVALGRAELHSAPSNLTGALPLEIAGCTITSDARIDDRLGLLKKLCLPIEELRSVSDSELILRAYLRWGDQCVHHLIGDFSFAIWNSTKREIFCARDHFGVKPFYYLHTEGRRFAFANTIASVASMMESSPTTDENKVADFLLEDFEDEGRTFFVGVSRLPPASTIKVSATQFRIQRYWRLDPDREVRLGSKEEYAEELQSLFREAVNCRLRSASPIGAMLSGGLDSSSITCIAENLVRDTLVDPIHTFSLVFDELPESDERPFIRSVLDGRRLIPHFVCGDNLSPFDDLNQVLAVQSEPVCAPNYSLTRAAWREASKCGARVLLDGLFGDNVVSHGIEHLHELSFRGRWLSLAHMLDQLIQRSGSSTPLRRPLFEYILQHGVKPRVPEGWLRLWRRSRGTTPDPASRNLAAFNPDFSARTNIRNRLLQMYVDRRIAKTGRLAHIESMNSGLISTALEIYARGSAEFNIEPRFPFLDVRIVEFCVAVPPNLKLRDGFTRAILRDAMSGYLPDPVRTRVGKGDLGWSFMRGIQNRRDFAISTLDGSKGFLSTYFSESKIHSIAQRLKDGKIQPEELFTLYQMVMMSNWDLALRSPSQVATKN